MNNHTQSLPLSDEAIQSNQRLAESLKKRAGVGDLPKFTSDAINTDATKAIPEIVALIREVETSDPKQARELYQQTLQGITPENQRLLENAYEDEVAAHQSVDTETHFKIENKSSDTTNTSAQKIQSGTLLARLEEMNAVNNESGFEGLVDTYGPEIREALSDLASYVNDPENAENVSSIAFETVLGVDPTDPNLKDAGLTAILGAMASKRARQMKAGAKLAKQLAQETGRVSEKSTMASKGVNMYNGPTIDRPFEKDYPNGYQADKAGNLTHDIDGRPLDSGGRIAGHRVVQGSEEAIPPEELKPIAKEATGRNVEMASQSSLGRNLGRTRFRRGTGEPLVIELSDRLTDDQVTKVLGHEVGHVIDQYAGEIPTQGIKKELNDLYDTLNNPNRNQSDPNMSANWGKRFTPKALGYKDADVDRELMAEAIRVYMVNPSYIKERAPNTAAKIRKWVNEHPELRKIVQFNSVAGATVIGTRSTSQNDKLYQKTLEERSAETRRDIKEGILRLGAKAGAAVGLDQSSKYLKHFLDGSGKDIVVPRDEARKDPFILKSEETNQKRFENNTFLGKTGNPEFNEKLLSLKDGQSVDLKDNWDHALSYDKIGQKTYSEEISRITEPDRFLATGSLGFKSIVNAKAKRIGDTIHIKGEVIHKGDDEYNFEDDDSYGAYEIQESGRGKPFIVRQNWKQHVEGTVKITDTDENGHLILGKPNFKWQDQD